MIGDNFFESVSTLVRITFGGIIASFTDERLGPFLAGVILTVGISFLFCIFVSFVNYAHSLSLAIRSVKRASGADELDRRAAFAQRFASIDQALFQIRRMSHAWREFRETLLRPESADGTVIKNSSRPHLFFNLSSLHMSFQFVRHTPNIFVGFGLLGTFIGLIAALTAALGSFSPGAGVENAQEAIRKLLTTASAKFYVSAAALLVSIVLTLFLRLLTSVLSNKVARFNNLLEERLLFVTPEHIARQQLETLREQTLQFRLFNTDLAMTIGRSVKEAVSETNGALLGKLETIAETFAQLVEASRLGAGEAISKAVDATISETLRTTSRVISDVGESLASLPSQLEHLSRMLDQIGQSAAQRQQAVGDEVEKQIERAMAHGADAMAMALQQGAAGTTSQLSQTSQTLASGAASIADSRR